MDRTTELQYLAMQANAHMIALAELFQPHMVIRKALDNTFEPCTRALMQANLLTAEMAYTPTHHKNKPDYAAVMFHLRMVRTFLFAIARMEPSLVGHMAATDKAMSAAVQQITTIAPH